MKYTFKIQEHTTYWQEGTVDVEADCLENAKIKCLAGEYDHHGDNEILLDTEGSNIEREITENITDKDEN